MQLDTETKSKIFANNNKINFLFIIPKAQNSNIIAAENGL